MRRGNCLYVLAHESSRWILSRAGFYQAQLDNWAREKLKSTLFFRFFFRCEIIAMTSVSIRSAGRLSRISWQGLQQSTTIPSSCGFRNRRFFAWANPNALSPQQVPGYLSSHEVIPQDRNLTFSFARSFSHCRVRFPRFGSGLRCIVSHRIYQVDIGIPAHAAVLLPDCPRPAPSGAFLSS